MLQAIAEAWKYPEQRSDCEIYPHFWVIVGPELIVPQIYVLI